MGCHTLLRRGRLLRARADAGVRAARPGVHPRDAAGPGGDVPGPAADGELPLHRRADRRPDRVPRVDRRGSTSTASPPKPTLGQVARGPRRRDRRGRRPAAGLQRSSASPATRSAGGAARWAPRSTASATASTPPTSTRWLQRPAGGQARHRDAEAPARRARRSASSSPSSPSTRTEVRPVKYESQKVAWWFFATCMLLFSLQIVYGFIMGFAHVGYDGLHAVDPLQRRARHPHQPAGDVAALGLHGRRVLHHPRGVRTASSSGRSSPACSWSRSWSSGVTADHRLPLQLVGGAQVPRDPAAARLPRGRQRAAVRLQHRHDHLEGAKRFTTTSIVLFFGLLAGGAALPAGHDPDRQPDHRLATGAGGWCTSGSRACGS